MSGWVKSPPLTNPKVTCGLFNKMFEISMKHECTTKFALNFQHISVVVKAHSVDIREAPEFTSRGADFLPGRGLTSNLAPLTRGRKKSRPPLTRGQKYPATLTRGQKNAWPPPEYWSKTPKNIQKRYFSAFWWEKISQEEQKNAAPPRWPGVEKKFIPPEEGSKNFLSFLRKGQ